MEAEEGRQGHAVGAEEEGDVRGENPPEGIHGAGARATQAILVHPAGEAPPAHEVGLHGDGYAQGRRAVQVRGRGELVVFHPVSHHGARGFIGVQDRLNPPVPDRMDGGGPASGVRPGDPLLQVLRRMDEHPSVARLVGVVLVKGRGAGA